MYEGGRPYFPPILLKRCAEEKRKNMISKLSKRGIAEAFLGKMKNRQLNETYYKTFGLRKVNHYEPKLTQVPPFFEENMISKTWPSRDIIAAHGTGINKSTRIVCKGDVTFKIESMSVRNSGVYGAPYSYFRRIVSLKINIINKYFSAYVTHNNNFLCKEIKDALPIKPSRTARFIGSSPYPIGVRPQKVTSASDDTINFLNQKEIKDKYPEVDKIDRKFSVEISWMSQMKEFQALCDPNPHGEKFSSMEILNKIIPHLDKIKLPDLPKPDPIGCLNVKTNSDAYAGKMSELYFERSNHGYVDQYIKPIAVEYNERIMTNLVPDQSVWTIGGRVRFMSELKINEDLRCRVLIMPEGVNKIVGLNTIDSFYKALVDIQKVHHDNEMSLGTSFIGGNFFKFDKVHQEFDNVIEADLKRYDQSVTEEQIVAAFALLRGCYPEGDDVDLLFLHHCAGFIFKTIVTPGGFMYRLSKGIATGSPFTSSIGTIVNWMNWSRISDSLGFESNRLIRVYGDDTLLFFKGFIHESVPGLVRRVLDITGFTTDPLLVKKVKDPPFLERPYTFLKTYSFHGLPCKNFFDSVERVLYPEFRTSCRFDRIEAINSAYFVSPFNYRAIEFLTDFKLFLLRQVQSNTSPLLRYDSFDREEILLSSFLPGAVLHINHFSFFEEKKFTYVWELRKKRKNSTSVSSFKRIDRGVISDAYIGMVQPKKINYDLLKEIYPKMNFSKVSKSRKILLDKVFFNISRGKHQFDKLEYYATGPCVRNPYSFNIE